MLTKGVNALVWNMFEQTGAAQYYLLYKTMGLGNPKTEKEREMDEIEKLTR